ncbi:MotA/TolQ/ExbB proton channel family protein [Tenacibaculum tangerinum]|uniref:MotA/TolQ/ExbB proton channel family protein n=1 Tax=Tenacibaculum tangerinum TaxID=3038772 RepID=A0ABY8L254_9FLAO|nr:MotA/TolQ/ExbB proton channel family protein [Tenacibaculum tangerinum]WGH75349.1 MotA/TolQ/ExbB proton channel family protein [Tenacibaculum tangerinum]
MRFIIEGGWMFMVPLLALLLLVIVLFIKGLKNNTEKNAALLKSISLFALFFGVLGFVLGLSQALGAIAIVNDIAPQVLAGGLKVGLLAPTFGLIIFLLGRLFDIILLLKREN